MMLLRIALVLTFASAALPQVAHAQGVDFSQNLAPFVPSPQEVVERMLEASRLRDGETLYDLGSGDGRIVITAAQKFRAKAVGVELSPDLCKQALSQVKTLGLANRVTILQADLLSVDLRPADVVTIYLLTSSNDRLKPNLEKELRTGARVVSHDFKIRGWTPESVEHVQAGSRVHTIYVYEIGKTAARK